MMTGVNLSMFPIAQGPALSISFSGQVQVMFGTTPGTTEYVKSGQLRALAVTTLSAPELLGGRPGLGRFREGLRGKSVVRPRCPQEHTRRDVDMLSQRANAALAIQRRKRGIADLGATVIAGSQAEFGKLIAEETEKWAKVIKVRNIKPE